MTTHLALALTLGVLLLLFKATTLFIGDTGLLVLWKRLCGALDSSMTELATFETAGGTAVEFAVTKPAASVTLAAGSLLGFFVVAVVSEMLIAATNTTRLGLVETCSTTGGTIRTRRWGRKLRRGYDWLRVWSNRYRSGRVAGSGSRGRCGWSKGSRIHIDHFNLLVARELGSLEKLWNVAFRVDMTLSCVVDKTSPVLTLHQGRGITQHPQGGFGTGETDVHTTDIAQETDTIVGGTHTGEDDDFTLSSLEGISGVEVDLLQNILAVCRGKLVLQLSQLALVWSDDTNLVCKVVVFDICD
jgi:hypothetical protein